MRCSKCGGYVTWRGPMSNLTHTECADCGARNSQAIDPDDNEGDWGCDHCRNDGTLNEHNCCPVCDAEFAPDYEAQ